MGQFMIVKIDVQKGEVVEVTDEHGNPADKKFDPSIDPEVKRHIDEIGKTRPVNKPVGGKNIKDVRGHAITLSNPCVTYTVGTPPYQYSYTICS